MSEEKQMVVKDGCSVVLRNGFVLGPVNTHRASNPPRDVVRFVLKNDCDDVTAITWELDGRHSAGAKHLDIVKVVEIDWKAVEGEECVAIVDKPSVLQECEYAVIVIGRAVVGSQLETVGKAGQRYVVVKDEYGVSSTPLNVELTPHTVLPQDTLTFPDLKSVGKFAKKWKGHPWWCSPEKFEAVKVVKKLRSVPGGYRLAPDYVRHCYVCD